MRDKSEYLGSTLVSQDDITQEQLDNALAHQRAHPKQLLGQILIEMGYVSERRILEVLAMRLGLEIVELDELTVDLDAANLIPRRLAEGKGILGLSCDAQSLTVAVNDPLDYPALDEVRQITGLDVKTLLAENAPLRQSINRCYTEITARQSVEASNRNFKHLRNADAPVIELLDGLLEQAIADGASDIHIEPFETGTTVRIRIDGMIQQYDRLPKSTHPLLISRIKILSNLDIAEHRLPQDGHFRVDQADKDPVNIRVALLPTVYGEKATLRLLTAAKEIDHSDHFGMDDESYRRFLPALDRPNGLIYLTGPTGSGKTTTLYMILEYLSRRPVNILTVEDPVEKNVAGVTQTQVAPSIGLTFETGLRALLRQDPDIIMVGETRDKETAVISVRAAITGHMVLSTLHTNDAVSSIARLTDMGADRFLVSDSLACVVAQRLVRKICPCCAKEMPVTEDERRFLGNEILGVKRGAGCSKCRGTGYKGRIAVHEILTVDRNIRGMIARKARAEEVGACAREEQGMKTLWEKGLELVKQGLTTPEEILKRCFSAFP